MLLTSTPRPTQAPASGVAITLTFCKKMKKLIATAALIVAFTSCGSEPVSSEPARSEVIGEWECAEFPDGFIRAVGGKVANPISRISIRDDGSLSASNFPVRSPYRFMDIDGVWGLSDPSITPSGAWSVGFQGHHLQCRRQGGELVLRCTIGGKDNYSAEYKKKQNKAQMATPRKPSD